MPPPLQLDFVLSATSVAGLPDTDVEVAVVGRSNVGKSSVINALANRKRLAEVSNTPGRTRLINLYAVSGGGHLVDLPGYGYAAVSKATKAAWPAMIEGYLLHRPQLAMIVVLVDGEIGPTKLDDRLLEWLQAHELPHAVVATKADKVKSSQRDRRKKELAARCGLHPSDVVWVSATSGAGIERLRGLVRTWLG